MKTKTTASNVAKYIIAEFQESGDMITNMKVQTLLYYVQAWHLGLYGSPAFKGEFQAWVYGAVESNVYGEYKEYHCNPINHKITKPKLNKNLIKHIQEVLHEYGAESVYNLVLLIRSEPPWTEARMDLPSDEPSNNVISDKTIKKYFAAYAQNNERTNNYALNYETIKALDKSRRGIGVKNFNSLKEMYKDLGI